MTEYTVDYDPNPVHVTTGTPTNLNVVAPEKIFNVSVGDKVYEVIFDNSDVSVSIADAIIKEVVEYLPEEDEVYDIEVDTSVAGVTYVGQAIPGTASSVASWRIKKISETATGSSVDWANGNADFVNVWDDRLTYTYGP